MGFMKVYGNGGRSTDLHKHKGIAAYECFTPCNSPMAMVRMKSEYAQRLYITPPPPRANSLPGNDLRDLSDKKAPRQKLQIYSRWCEATGKFTHPGKRMEGPMPAEARKANTWSVFGLYIFLVEEKTAPVGG